MSEYYKDAKDVLKEIMETLSIKKNEKEEIINREWKNIVGQKISTYASFEKVDKKTLYISTDDNAYLPMILSQKKRIIEKYNKIFEKDKILYLHVIVKSY